MDLQGYQHWSGTDFPQKESPVPPNQHHGPYTETWAYGSGQGDWALPHQHQNLQSLESCGWPVHSVQVLQAVVHLLRGSSAQVLQAVVHQLRGGSVQVVRKVVHRLRASPVQVLREVVHRLQVSHRRLLLLFPRDFVLSLLEALGILDANVPPYGNCHIVSPF